VPKNWFYTSRSRTTRPIVAAGCPVSRVFQERESLPLDKDIYELDPEELASFPSMPGSLEDALDALQSDHDFLLKGDVFTEELLRTYVDYKRVKEVDAVRLRPHPWEFQMYYDI
jgi:glutamine synthetase